MKSLLLALTLLLTACAGRLEHTNQVSIDPALQSYVDAFISDARSQDVEIHIEDLVIQWGQPDVTTELGVCTTGPNLTPTITIAIHTSELGDYWSNAPETLRKSLIYHELGHCVLNRVHNFNVESDGQPVSIMTPILANTQCWEQNYEHYIVELFSQRDVNYYGVQKPLPPVNK